MRWWSLKVNSTPYQLQKLGQSLYRNLIPNTAWWIQSKYLLTNSKLCRWLVTRCWIWAIRTARTGYKRFERRCKKSRQRPFKDSDICVDISKYATRLLFFFFCRFLLQATEIAHDWYH